MYPQVRERQTTHGEYPIDGAYKLGLWYRWIYKIYLLATIRISLSLECGGGEKLYQKGGKHPCTNLYISQNPVPLLYWQIFSFYLPHLLERGDEP